MRTTLGKTLHKWRSDLIADLGGQDNISTQQSALVDPAVKSKLLLDAIDAWLLTQPTLISKRKKALLPAVLQRQTLADGLARYLSQLGLERRQREIDADPIKRIHAERKAAQGNGAAEQGKWQALTPDRATASR